MLVLTFLFSGQILQNKYLTTQPSTTTTQHFEPTSTGFLSRWCFQVQYFVAFDNAFGCFTKFLWYYTMSCLRNCFHQLILFFTPPLVQERARAKAKAKAPRHNFESWKNFRGPTFSKHETHGKVSGISICDPVGQSKDIVKKVFGVRLRRWSQACDGP